MAALGLIELLVSQGLGKDEVHKTVLAFNSCWFPQNYLDLSYHSAKNGRDFTKVPASEILAATLSSVAGSRIVEGQIGQVNWPILQGGKGNGP